MVIEFSADNSKLFDDNTTTEVGGRPGIYTSALKWWLGLLQCSERNCLRPNSRHRLQSSSTPLQITAPKVINTTKHCFLPSMSFLAASKQLTKRSLVPTIFAVGIAFLYLYFRADWLPKRTSGSTRKMHIQSIPMCIYYKT